MCAQNDETSLIVFFNGTPTRKFGKGSVSHMHTERGNCSLFASDVCIHIGNQTIVHILRVSFSSP